MTYLKVFQSVHCLASAQDKTVPEIFLCSLHIREFSDHRCHIGLSFSFSFYCLQEKEEAGQRLARETEKLVNGDFCDMQDTQEKVTQLQTNLQLFKQRVEERRKLLLETVAFYKKNSRVSYNFALIILLTQTSVISMRNRQNSAECL